MIQTVSLKDKSLEGLSKKIEDFQNNNNLISKGSLPFFDTESREFCVIMFFAKGNTEINTPQKQMENSEVKNGLGTPIAREMLGNQQKPITSAKQSNDYHTSGETSNQVKLASEKQWSYAQQLADDLNVALNLAKNTTSKEISKVIEELKLKKYGGKDGKR